MRLNARNMVRAGLIGAALLALGGCVAYPGGPYYGAGYGYYPSYYGPSYYGPPVTGTVWIGGGGWHGGGHDHDHDHWH